MTVAPSPSLPLPEWTPEALTAAYEALTASLPAEAAPEGWEALFWRWNDLRCRVSGEMTRRYYKAAQDTRDAEADDSFRMLREQLLPVAEAFDAELRAAFLASPARAELEARLSPQLFVKLELDQSAFAADNVALKTEEAELVARYQRISGQAAMPVGDEVWTLPMANARLIHDDGAVRRAAWAAANDWTLANRLEFHAIFDQLVDLRTRMAQNLGEPNFVGLGYRKMGRTDYGPDEVAVFRESIRTHFTPLLAKVRRAHAELLGTPTVAPADQNYFPGLTLGAGVVPVAGQLAQAQTLFDRLHPRLAAHFRRMTEEGLIDLANRPGKQPGAFAASLDDEGRVVIFCNSTGDESDVVTLTHEMGHAFQAWESQWIAALDLRFPTLDAAELHSMGMEFLALKEITAFFTPEQARRFRRLKLIKSISRLPYMAVVDAFQHWVYEHPGHGHAEREAQWSALWEAFVPGLDFAGAAAHRATRWMRQEHIFGSPFYYIDYALAEVGALQLWRMAEVDHAGAMEAYLKLCSLGGSCSMRRIFEAGGLTSPFDPDVLAPLAAAIAAELEL